MIAQTLKICRISPRLISNRPRRGSGLRCLFSANGGFRGTCVRSVLVTQVVLLGGHHEFNFT